MSSLHRQQLSKIFHLSIDSVDVLPAIAADRPATVTINTAQQNHASHHQTSYKSPYITPHQTTPPTTARSDGPSQYPTPLSPGASASSLKPLAPSANPQLQSSSYAVASQLTQQLMGFAGEHHAGHSFFNNNNGNNMAKTTGAYHSQHAPLFTYTAAPESTAAGHSPPQVSGMTRAGSSGLLFDMDI